MDALINLWILQELQVAVDIFFVLSVLSFLGTGSYQKCIGLNLNMPMEQSTFSKILNEVTDAMICDSKLKILNRNARFPGAVHDSAIWEMSSARQLLERKFIMDELNSSWLIDINNEVNERINENWLVKGRRLRNAIVGQYLI
ncbi:hypothetical protein NQ314_015670 [Rhamnusium bicolor]|uniref:Uncharacterized protein n=1 Tax=Rhamnusium bicolor TaxID=1586634 RepID=A0AAV8WXJ6_9CUCU|nr:hypothetical protein NQ314_015670 [Rhamnusium bicolor]